MIPLNIECKTSEDNFCLIWKVCRKVRSYTETLYGNAANNVALLGRAMYISWEQKGDSVSGVSSGTCRDICSSGSHTQVCDAITIHSACKG